MAAPGAEARGAAARRAKFARYVALTGLVLLLVLELGLRLVLGNFAAYRLYTRDTGDDRCVGLAANVRVPYTGVFLKAAPVVLDSNAMGYRGTEFARQRTPGVFRIATVGDSFTYGMGVAADETFAANLQRALTDEVGPVEVLNFGVPGVELPDVPAQIRFAGGWNPDLVVYFVESGDITLVGDGLLRSLCMANDTPGWVGPLAMNCYVCRIPLFAAARRVLRSPSNPDNRASAELVRPLFDDVRDAAADIDAEVVAVAVTGLVLLADGDASDIAVEAGIPWLYLRDGVIEAHRIPRDGHYNAAGTAWFGVRTAEWLLEQGYVPRTAEPPP